MLPPDFPPPPSDEKGLANLAGQNNCFLNVTIQSLWHLKPFREAFDSQPLAHPPQCQCVHCALSLILTNYRFAQDSTLSPDVLRQSLGLLYAKESKFQIGDLSDAVECFDAICSCIHQVSVDGGSIDSTCDPICSTHETFRIVVEDAFACKKCGVKSSDVQSMFLHYVYASEIIKRHAKTLTKRPLETILKKLNSIEPHSCLECKAGPFPVKRILWKPFPKVFSLCIAWANPNPNVSEIVTVLGAIDSEIDVTNIFDGVANGAAGNGKSYRIRGVISYYLQHYAAFFFSDEEQIWFSFDDVSVQKIGPSWKDVVRKCRMGHAKPVLVFYEEATSTQGESSPAIHRTKHKRYHTFRSK